MADTTKDNFVLHESVQKPLKELEELNAQIKKKKQEVKKAMFYAKHPTLKQAKEEFDTKMNEEATVKFNQSLSEEPKRPIKEPVRDEPQPVVRKTTPNPVQVKEHAPTPTPAPAPAPAQPIEIEKTTVPHVQVKLAPKTVVADLSGKWF